MKKISITCFALLSSTILLAQVSGNINNQYQVHLPNQNINIPVPSDHCLISVKGLANVKADSYVAIFGVLQSGKTAEEVNDLMSKRLTSSFKEINTLPGIETFVDMVSFVPVYEFETDKKVFSKSNYIEIPKGFELKKNIHIKFSDMNQLNTFINILSKEGIYDLVRVDYFSTHIENIKKELMTKAKNIFQEKIKSMEILVGKPFTSEVKKITDGYKVVYPLEMYKSYEAFNSSSLNLKKSLNVSYSDKSTTMYYQPILDKEFDFVINPIILEPVIQVMYEIKVTINQNEKETISPKEYLIVTPNGEVKNLNLIK